MSSSGTRTAMVVGIVLVVAGVVAIVAYTVLDTADQEDDIPGVDTIAEGLRIPWALDFLPDGSSLFTERVGRVWLIDETGDLLEEPLLEMDDVAAVGEGGLLGLAVHPDIEDTGWVYLYHTYRTGDASLANRVVRFDLQDRKLTNRTVILDGIPGASRHDGGRIGFGPDGLLYISTGDAAEADLAQDPLSLAGKFLRVLEDGSIPEGNPFPDSPVFSLGHRNPQGFDWDADGRLWATEHGPAGHDEINLIEAGKDYGWPVIQGDETMPGMETPVLHSGSATWAPSGAQIVDDRLYFAGLRGESLFELDLADPSEVTAHFEGEFGRLREVRASPDNFLYILTSNDPGEGKPLTGDDRIVRTGPVPL